VRRHIEGRIHRSADLVDAAIIQRCKEGDRDAWNLLVESTYKDVYTLCLRILRNPDDAAEATQDAYIKVWRGIKSFRGDAAFATWLYRVAGNTAISKGRSRTRRQGHEVELDAETMAAIPGTDSTENAATARVDLAGLEVALAELPDHYRWAVLLRDVYGLSMAEIAGELKISETAAKVRVHRARKALKVKMFSDNNGDEK
jgi:RNA polymerase sigma-70 factor, ECF subfamily